MRYGVNRYSLEQTAAFLADRPTRRRRTGGQKLCVDTGKHSLDVKANPDSDKQMFEFKARADSPIRAGKPIFCETQLIHVWLFNLRTVCRCCVVRLFVVHALNVQCTG